MTSDDTFKLLDYHQYHPATGSCTCGRDYSEIIDEQAAHAKHLAELVENAFKPKCDQDMVEVLLTHLFMPTYRECLCGELTEGSAAHADHLAKELAEAGFGIAPLDPDPQPKLPHLAVAAREYHKAVMAMHEDEHGNPHCVLRCNAIDENSGIVSETRFHEEALKSYTDAEMRFQVEYANELSRLDKEGVKPEPSKKRRGAGPVATLESELHAWGPSGICRMCNHWASRHEIESVEERTFSSLDVTTVITDVHCNECEEEDEI